MVRIIIGLALALILPMGSATLARAQSSSELAAARGLFQQGLTAARAGEWETARRHFERSYEIAPRSNTLLNLAGARLQTGQLVAAAEDYRRFIAEAEGRARRLRPQARAALAELEPRIAHVEIHIDGLLDSDTVRLDADELPRAALGIDVPIDPGEHVITVGRESDERARETFTVVEGARQTVTIDASVSLEVPVASRTEAPAAAFEATPSDEDDDSGLVIGGIIGAAVAVALGVTIGVVVAVESAGPHQGSVGDGVLVFD